MNGIGLNVRQRGVKCSVKLGVSYAGGFGIEEFLGLGDNLFDDVHGERVETPNA